LIDELRALVHGAKQVPLRDQVRVDKRKLYGLLDQMRSTIPEEIKQARWIVKEREAGRASSPAWSARATSGSGSERSRP
jgi:hypothetical protein